MAAENFPQLVKKEGGGYAFPGSPGAAPSNTNASPRERNRDESPGRALAHDLSHRLNVTGTSSGPGGSPDARTDRLRGKLISVGERFIGFDKVIEEDASKRKEVEDKRYAEVRDVLGRLEKALNAEIKRRVEANKTLQQITEQMANEVFERLQKKVHRRVEKLTGILDGLMSRGAALEHGIAQMKGEVPSKLQMDATRVIREVHDMRTAFESERRARQERDGALVKRVMEAERGTEQKFESELVALEEQYTQLKRQFEGLARADTSIDEQFRGFVLEELSALKNGLVLCAQTREQSDDEVVQAINQYTTSLQKGLRAANLR